MQHFVSEKRTSAKTTFLPKSEEGIVNHSIFHLRGHSKFF